MRSALGSSCESHWGSGGSHAVTELAPAAWPTYPLSLQHTYAGEVTYAVVGGLRAEMEGALRAHSQCNSPSSSTAASSVSAKTSSAPSQLGAAITERQTISR